MSFWALLFWVQTSQKPLIHFFFAVFIIYQLSNMRMVAEEWLCGISFNKRLWTCGWYSHMALLIHWEWQSLMGRLVIMVPKAAEWDALWKDDINLVVATTVLHIYAPMIALSRILTILIVIFIILPQTPHLKLTNLTYQRLLIQKINQNTSATENLPGSANHRL